MIRRVKLTSKCREAIFNAQNGACAICGEFITGKYDIDHHQAIIHGGCNGRDNLRALCKPCHAIKTAEDVKANAKVKRIISKNGLRGNK